MQDQQLPRRLSTKAQKTRRKLLEAAVSLIGERGYSGASVDDIAERAGVSKGTTYVYFKTKSALARFILEDGIEDLIDQFECACTQAPTAQAAMHSMISLFIDRVFADVGFSRFFVSELWREGRDWSEDLRPLEARLCKVIESQIVRGQKEGAYRADVDVTFEAIAFIGMVLTASLYYASQAAAEPKRAQEIKEVFKGRIYELVHRANASAN